MIGSEGHVSVPVLPPGHPVLVRTAEQNIETWRLQTGPESEVRVVRLPVSTSLLSQVNLANQGCDEDGQKQEQRAQDQHSRFAALHHDFSAAESFGSGGHHSMKGDEEQNECQFDVQPRRVEIVVGICRDQAGAGQDGQQGTWIGQPAEEDALEASESLACFRRGLLRVAS
jgi:hypothetical protein